MFAEAPVYVELVEVLLIDLGGIDELEAGRHGAAGIV